MKPLPTHLKNTMLIQYWLNIHSHAKNDKVLKLKQHHINCSLVVYVFIDVQYSFTLQVANFNTPYLKEKKA